MTETGSTVERLRIITKPEDAWAAWSDEELEFVGSAVPALLAVVEAAQDVCDDPKSGVPGIMATLRLVELRKSLAALHTQASDEGN